MAIVQHRQISESIKKVYAPHIDITDVSSSKDQQLEPKLLSRGLAAFALSYLAETDPKTSAEAVVDGFGDGGLDAVYFDSSAKTLYLIQSKWNETHTGSVDQAGTLKFAAGVKALLNGRSDYFSGIIMERWAEIDRHVIEARKVILCIVYSGSGSFSPECKSAMDDLISEIDETNDLVEYEILKQDRLHGMLLQGAIGGPINATVNLIEWGKIGEQIEAYYGQIDANDLASLHRKHGSRLFSKNIRSFLGSDTSVNAGIRQTLAEAPELFWFFNNGVTVLCSSIQRRAAGSAGRSSALLDCSGIEVVNGAQTIGSISAELKSVETLSESAARVPIRLISLENAPEGFGSDVTRATNTQNRIDARNFVALDIEQERIKGEFALDGISYEYRQGEIESSSDSRLGLVEATLALACTNDDVDLAIQAKREVGKLWEDITQAPYRKLFNPSVSSDFIWSRVIAFRKIDEEIRSQEFIRKGKSLQVATHGNRIACHIAYKILQFKGCAPDLKDVDEKVCSQIVKNICDSLFYEIENFYPNAYVAVIFKNRAKCIELSKKVFDDANSWT